MIRLILPAYSVVDCSGLARIRKCIATSVRDKVWRPRAPCCEMRKAIWDKATGEQLAWIEDGKVFGVGMNEPVGKESATVLHKFAKHQTGYNLQSTH
jgi:hypothetical protein